MDNHGRYHETNARVEPIADSRKDPVQFLGSSDLLGENRIASLGLNGLAAQCDEGLWIFLLDRWE